MSNEQRISTWTEIQIPPAVNIQNLDNSKNSCRLIAGLRCLTAAPGVDEVVWGRVVERPSVVILLAVWRTRDALRNFTTSSSYKEYLFGLSVMEPPTIYNISFNDRTWYLMIITRYTAITKIYLPKPVSERQRERIDSLEGPIDPCIWGSSHSKIPPACSKPRKGWVETAVPGNNRCMSAVCVHFWETPGREREFKRMYRRNLPTQPVYESVDMVTYWNTMLKNAGVQDWEEEHCDFKRLPVAADAHFGIHTGN